MGAGLVNVDIGSVISGVGGIIDNLHTSDEERLQMGLEDKRIDAGMSQGQMAINRAEAGHRSFFVAGWRPAIGWVGALAMAYQFLLYPFLIWLWAILQAKAIVPKELTPPPILDTSALYTVVLGMLGIGGMRTWEKTRGVQTSMIKGLPAGNPASAEQDKKWWQAWK